MRKLLFILALLCQVATAGEVIPAYENRFGRDKPVIVIVGENSGTELTDFAIPYGVLARSGTAQVLTLGTQPGPLTMRPALKIQPHATIAEFDARFPEGADYLIVPAVVKSGDATLIAWVTAQAAKGATVVSICDGALVVANAGLFKGHRATGHWATEAYRKKHYADTEWLANTRYVADGKVISSAGVSAAMPTALALVEAIGGRARAADLAQQLGVSDWSTTHNSDIFRPRLGTNLSAYITGYTNHWFSSPDSIGLPVAAGVDEITLAFTADAWSRTKRSRAYSVAASAEPLQSLSGLTILPDRVSGAADEPKLLLPLPNGTLPGNALDQALAGMEQRYGRSTAFLVALEFEYPFYR